MSRFNLITVHETFGFDRLFLYLKDAYRILFEAYQEIIVRKAKTPYTKPADKKKWDLENILTEDLVRIAQEKTAKFPYEWDTESKDLAKRNRIDITIIYQLGIGFERRLGIECKLLISNSKNNYYVNGGVNKFVSGYYSEKMPLAGMIGYIAKGVISEIVENINHLVDKKTTYQILTKEKMLGNDDHTYLSIHQRKKELGNISLYHMFLDFNKIIVLS